MNNDLISREALKEKLQGQASNGTYAAFYVNSIINNAPTVDVGIEIAQEREKLYEESKKLYMFAKILGKDERLQGEWIPIKYRPMTSEERIKFAEHYGIEYCDTLEEKAFDCPMPEDGQKILISTSWGVDIDVADNDIDGEGFICYGLEGNGDWDSVIAWQPLPKPYQKGGAE